jgi:hypothetical protein
MNLRPALLAAAALTAVLAALALCRWGGGGNEDLSAIAQVVQHGEELERHREPWPLTAPDPDADGEIRWAVRRQEAKRQVTCALIDGRLTLRQAAAQFRDIDADLPDKARRWRPPEYTEEEWPYRQVISYVDAELAGPRGAPALAQEWVARLEAELRGDRQPEGASPPATGR